MANAELPNVDSNKTIKRISSKELYLNPKAKPRKLGDGEDKATRIKNKKEGTKNFSTR